MDLNQLNRQSLTIILNYTSTLLFSDRMVKSNLIERIEKIEHEVELLKKDLTKKPVKMKGRLEGIKLEDEDFEEAKKSLFKSN